MLEESAFKKLASCESERFRGRARSNHLKGQQGMRIALILPKRRLAPWHSRLTEALAKKHTLNVFMDEHARAYPSALSAWLRAERLLYRERRPASSCLSAEGLPHSGELDEHAFDTVIDLSERAEPRHGSISIRYNGSTDSMALIGALLGRQTPYLTVCGEGAHDVLTESIPAIDNKSRLGRGLQLSFGRCISLVERALRGGQQRARSLARAAAAPPISCSLPAHIRRFAVGTTAKVMLNRWLPTNHWCVALRRDSGAFTPVADDGRCCYADPFLYARHGRTFLFVEDYRFAAKKAVISAAEVVGDRVVAAPVPVLERPYHLSYPLVLGDAGAIYMLPETWQSDALELYRAVEFPWKWELDRVLIDGIALADATPVFHENRWWLFASAAEYGTTHHDELLIFYSDKLVGPWRPHSGNPVKSDCRSARSAGRIVRRGNRLFRPAQDCEESYGSGIVWHEIVELSPSRFREIEIARIMAPRALGFDGLHTFDQVGQLQTIDLKPVRGSAARHPMTREALRLAGSGLDLAMQMLPADGDSRAVAGYAKTRSSRAAEGLARAVSAPALGAVK